MLRHAESFFDGYWTAELWPLTEAPSLGTLLRSKFRKLLILRARVKTNRPIMKKKRWMKTRRRQLGAAAEEEEEEEEEEEDNDDDDDDDDDDEAEQNKRKKKRRDG